MTEDEMLDGMTNSMDMSLSNSHSMDKSLSKLREMVKDKEAWCAVVHEVTEFAQTHVP